DTGEGMFAYGVWRQIGVDGIDIDVFAHLHSPGIPTLTTLAMQLWAPPFVGSPVEPEQSFEPWSVPLRAAFLLGSTPRSLVHVDTGEPFQVCKANLTRTGDAIMHSMDHTYNSHGDILTFAGRPPKQRRW